MAPSLDVLIGRFMRLPRRSDETWQGGLVRMPMWVDDDHGTPHRPRAAVWVSVRTGLVNIELEPDFGKADETLALRAAVELGLKFARCRPARLEVTDEALGRFILQSLRDPELQLRVRDGHPDVDERVREMAEHQRGAPLPPGALRARGVTIERMRSFAEAAREFHEAAPWRLLSDEDLIRIEAPEVGRGFRWVTVLGSAGMSYGLGFFPSSAAFEKLFRGDTPEDFVGQDGRWTVLYGDVTELPFEDADLWDDHQLPVAGPAAYPVAIWFGPDGALRRPAADDVATVEAVMRALARSSEAQIDTGRWSVDVPTPDGPRTVTLAIPELLSPLDAAPAARRPRRAAHGAMEQLLPEVQRFAASSSFEAAADAERAIQLRFSGFADVLPSSASTPLELAQELCFAAQDARGRRRIQLARKALELSGDCADAYVLLAEERSDAEQARDLYARGVAAAERALGSGTFEEVAGHFWSDIRTRPYMRARLGLAQCLETLGDRDQAIDHYRELLRLNPDDNQGVRYSLVAALLLAGRDAEAAPWLAQYDDPTALWQYARALAAFRRAGDDHESRARLREAHSVNRHAAGYLSGEDAWRGEYPSSYAVRSREEAAVCESVLGDAYRATPGAVDWLRTHSRDTRRGAKSRKRRR